uniref:Uncharacterized protein n=1 Tax=Ascaris lumbricoides TaxID=6252 RepID=A0A0M3HZ14_ASCLU
MNQRRWFSGRMLACHAGGPGPIPGRRNTEEILTSVGGSVVECSPATRAARVRFPADATRLKPCSASRNGQASAPRQNTKVESQKQKQHDPASVVQW